jgi:hypothetical protein
MLGLARYMFKRLIVAFVRNWEPALPPAGSGLLGFVLAADLLNADPLPVALADLAAMNFLLFDFLYKDALLCDFFVIFILLCLF